MLGSSNEKSLSLIVVACWPLTFPRIAQLPDFIPICCARYCRLFYLDGSFWIYTKYFSSTRMKLRLARSHNVLSHIFKDTAESSWRLESEVSPKWQTRHRYVILWQASRQKAVGTAQAPPKCPNPTLLLQLQRVCGFKTVSSCWWWLSKFQLLTASR